MREFKFRAWHKAHEKMFKILGMYTIGSNAKITKIQLDGQNNMIPIGCVELMQYTGLKDKNGKEIYESDIVKCEESLGVIRFKDARYCIDWIYNKSFLADDLGKNGPYSEVIGNIYKNPELVEVER